MRFSHSNAMHNSTKSTPINTFYFYCTGNEVIVPLSSCYDQILHNYIQIIYMKYFYSIKNEIIALHYSFYILQYIFLYKNIQTFFYDTVSTKLLFCIMNYFPSC